MTASPAAPSPEASRHAALCHLSAAAGLVVPLGTVFGPLVAWVVLRDTGPFVDRQGRHAVDINLAFLVVEVLLFALLVAWAFLGLFGPRFVAYGVIFVTALVGLVHAAVVIYAAIRTSEGEDVRVPFRIPLLGP